MSELIEIDRDDSDDDEDEPTNRRMIQLLEADFLQAQASRVESEFDDGESELSPRTRCERSTLHDIFSREGENWVCTLPAIDFKQGRNHRDNSVFALKNGWRHLENWHPNLSRAVKSPSRNIPVSDLVNIYKTKSSDLNAITNYFFTETKTTLIVKFRWALFFILEHIPYTSAGERFAQTFKLTGGDPHKLITPTTLSKVFLPALLAAVEERLVDFLKNIRSVSITYDGWTDKAKNKFVVVTAHCLDRRDDKWKTRRLLLEAIFFDESATIVNLHSAISAVIKKKLPKNTPLAAVITDGAPNMLGSSEIISGGESLWCICHRLDLVVTESLAQDPKAVQLIGQVRSYSKAVNGSTELKREFRLVQKVGKPLSLSIDMPTRWNSIYRMLSKFKRLYQVILELSLRDEFQEISSLPMYTELGHLCDILEPLAAISTGLQGEGNLALAFYLLNAYLNDIKGQAEKNTDNFGNLRCLIKQNFVARFETDISHVSLLTTASLLWPQSDGHVMPSQLQKQCWLKLIDDLDFLYPEDQTVDASTEDPDSLYQLIPSRSIFQSSASEEKTRMLRALEEFRKKWTDIGKEISERKLNPLEYWSSPPQFLKLLQPLAEMYLTIPCSSAASESVASVLGRIKTQTRANLLPKNLIAEATISLNRGLFESDDDFINRAIIFHQNSVTEESESELSGSSSE